MRFQVLVSLSLLTACESGRLASGGEGAFSVELDAGSPQDARPGQDPPPPADAGVPPRVVADAAPPPPADAAPPTDPETFPEGEDACGDVRTLSKVYNGTRQPTVLPLTPGQVLAVGSFNGCSGALIAPRHVLSASHCDHRVGATFCMGENPDDPDRCLRATRVYNNPRADMTLLELERDAADVMPGVEPIPILTERMDQSWIGRTFEAAGYGQTEYGGFNTRWFTAEPLVDLSSDTLTIDGQGRRGVCFGDSGGPVMAIASDGTARVAGDLSNGDGNCVGRDNFTRTDVFVDWIEQYTGPTVVGGAACGDITAEGRCRAGVAQWCEGDVLQTERCDTCGFDVNTQGYRCLQGADPCGGVDAAGACDGDVARWCDRGVPRARNCGACDQVCGVVQGSATCVDDPCAGLDYLGRCNGDVAVWCEEGELQSEDCGRRGRSCGWVDDQTGYYCQ